jgi:ferritin-like metal-binding protein YciE
MPGKNKVESFALILSDLHKSMDRTATAWGNITKHARPEMKEKLEARFVLARKVLDNLDRCLKLVVLVQSLRRNLAELQNETVRQWLILTKTTDLIGLRLAEYKALIASAEISGYDEVVVLLEGCVVDMLTFVERNIAQLT